MKRKKKKQSKSRIYKLTCHTAHCVIYNIPINTVSGCMCNRCIKYFAVTSLVIIMQWEGESAREKEKRDKWRREGSRRGKKKKHNWQAWICTDCVSLALVEVWFPVRDARKKVNRSIIHLVKEQWTSQVHHTNNESTEPPLDGSTNLVLESSEIDCNLFDISVERKWVRVRERTSLFLREYSSHSHDTHTSKHAHWVSQV